MWYSFGENLTSTSGAHLGVDGGAVPGARLPLTVGRLHLAVDALHHRVAGAAPRLQGGHHARHRLRPHVPAGGVLHLQVAVQLVQFTADHVCGRERGGGGGSGQGGAGGGGQVKIYTRFSWGRPGSDKTR